MLKIVAIQFPFLGDSKLSKPRPALALTEPIGKHKHILVAFMTTQIESIDEYTLVVDQGFPGFNKTGLKYTTAIVLHKLYTCERESVKKEVGILPEELTAEVHDKLKQLFKLDR